MRAEFAELLKPLYPQLQNNDSLVRTRKVGRAARVCSLQLSYAS